MINIQEYKKYTGEKNIAMLDNSSIEFLHKIEWCYIYSELGIRGSRRFYI